MAERKCCLKSSYLAHAGVWLVTVIVIMAFLSISSHKTVFKRKADEIRARGVIATLIRSDNRSILWAINMIHSVVQFHSTKNQSLYPLIIFHESDLEPSQREYILACTLKRRTQLKISFATVDFSTSARPENGSRSDKPIGYRLMCRFWTSDIYYHSAIVQGEYEYLMRMDVDSYFSDTTKRDLFVYAKERKLDYVYRDVYREPMTPMEPVLRHFLHDITHVSKCIYNNFFIMRLKWFYDSQRVQTFVNELLRDDLIIREYIGDGCAHAAMLKIDNQVRVKRLTDLSYGHNRHVMLPGRSMIFVDAKQLEQELEKSCRQLSVLRDRGGIITQIPVP